MFDLPVTSTVASVAAYFQDVAGGLWPFIALAIGIPLAFYLISRLKSLVPGR